SRSDDSMPMLVDVPVAAMLKLLRATNIANLTSCRSAADAGQRPQPYVTQAGGSSMREAGHPMQMMTAIPGHADAERRSREASGIQRMKDEGGGMNPRPRRR